MASDNEFSPSSPSNSIITSSINSTINSTINTPLTINFQKTKKKSTDINDPTYKLNDSDSPIYIIRNGLITRSLLPIKEGIDRQVKISCTL